MTLVTIAAMNKRVVGGKVALLAGLGAIAVLAVGLLYWQEFVARYHVFRLSREPGYLHEILALPKGTAQRVAIESYLKTRRSSVCPNTPASTSVYSWAARR